MATFTERAIDALYDLLTDGSTGLNAETLPAMRTALSVGTDVLPNIGQIEKWYHRGPQATAFPYLSIVVNTTTGETELNSRLYSVSFDLGLVVLGQNIAGNEVAVMTAAWRYGDAIKTIMQRRTPMGKEGWTLDGSTRIVRATVESQIPGSDPTIAADNVALLTTVSVLTAEEY